MHKPAKMPRDHDDVNCGYCGFGQDPAIRPVGGEFVEQTSVPSISGVTNATSNLNARDGGGTTIFERQNDDSGGCAFCNSPEWLRGGRISWGRFRPRRR